MSCETYNETVAGMELTYTQLSARKSLLLKYKLIGIAGSAIGNLSSGIGKSGEEQMTVFSSALQNIFKANEPEVVLSVIEEILKPVFVNGERVDIDRDFTGEAEKMYRIVFWALNKEYGNFIRGLESLM